MLSLLNSIRSYFKRKSLFFAFLMVVTSLNQSMAQADRMNATRQPLLVTSEISLKALAFGQTDEQTVLVVAKDTELDSRATILKSTDQGETWRVKAVYNKQYLSNIAFLNPKLGVAVGIGGFAL